MLVSTPQSRLALQVLAPTILVVALMGCMRGYFQGLGSMVPTAVSQIVEQIVNAAVSIGAAWALFRYGAKLDALFSTETAAYAWGAAGTRSVPAQERWWDSCSWSSSCSATAR